MKVADLKSAENLVEKHAFEAAEAPALYGHLQKLQQAYKHDE